MKIKLLDIYFLIIFLMKGFGFGGTDKIYILAFGGGCLAVLLKIFSEKYTRKELCIVCLLFAIGVLNFVNSRNTMILFTAIAIFGMKNTDVDRIIKLAFFSKTFSFLVLQLAVILGIIENRTLEFWRNDELLIRYCMGYSHPNEAHLNLTIIIILAVYLFGQKFNFLHYIFLGALNIFYCQFTYSRTGLLICFIILAINLVCKNKKCKNIFIKFSRYSYVFFFMITLVISFMYDKMSIIQTLDRILTGRIQYNYHLLHSGFPSLFGEKISSDLALIDNGYLSLLYQGGVLAFLWYSYFIIRTQMMIKDYKKAFLMFSFLLYGMTESFMPSVSINISLLLLAEYIFRKLKHLDFSKSRKCINEKDNNFDFRQVKG